MRFRFLILKSWFQFKYIVSNLEGDDKRAKLQDLLERHIKYLYLNPYNLYVVKADAPRRMAEIKMFLVDRCSVKKDLQQSITAGKISRAKIYPNQSKIRECDIYVEKKATIKISVEMNVLFYTATYNGKSTRKCSIFDPYTTRYTTQQIHEKLQYVPLQYIVSTSYIELGHSYPKMV